MFLCIQATLFSVLKEKNCFNIKIIHLTEIKKNQANFLCKSVIFIASVMGIT
jgi:hypothetical protein